MKVIKKGSVANKKTFVVACDECHSILQGDTNDIRPFVLMDSSGIYCDSYIICPVCQNQILSKNSFSTE